MSGTEPRGTAEEGAVLRSTATIETSRAERYRDQLAKHGAGMLRQAHSGQGHDVPPIRSAATTDGSLTLDLAWGRCTITATDEALILAAEADTREELAKIQAGVGRRVTGIGRRDGLVVTWSPVEGAAGLVDGAAQVTSRRSQPLVVIAIAAIVVVVVAVHIGIVAIAMRQSWAWWALAVLAGVIVLKLLVGRHFAGAIRAHGLHRPPTNPPGA
jgi:hypothetical protein